MQNVLHRPYGRLAHPSPLPLSEGSDKPDPVAWSMPDGFTLGAEPSKLDASLVGKHIYMRWKD